MAALQKLPVTYVWTHDSIAVGEDGPTHEPVEQLASVRSMPNLDVIRPADGNEVVAAWRHAASSKTRPTALILTRQNLPVLEGTAELAEEGIHRGAYILSPEKGQLTGIIIATGSEVALAIEAQKQLGDGVRVVSMPSMNRFDEQDSAYREKILPIRIRRRLAVEAGTSYGWGKYVGIDGATVTIDRWGASAPGNKIFEEYGFTVENVVASYKKLN
jgi:transketolase